MRLEETETLKMAAGQLMEYLQGKRKVFDILLAPEGTVFQKKVWGALLTIPYGETSSYGKLAENIGKPGAARAVGMANNRNPIPVIIPCHRVIGADGSLTGYGGGLSMKERLLALEKATAIV
jgi:methylated-DNA-[protein]-cysteine S-methyltransferase